MGYNELLQKAKQAKSADELLTIAKENGISISEEEAEAHFEQLNRSGELSDDELDDVAGGGCFKNEDRYVDTLKKMYEGKRVRCNCATCPVCGSDHGIVLRTRLTHTGWDDFWCYVYCFTHQNQLILETNQMELDLILE